MKNRKNKLILSIIFILILIIIGYIIYTLISNKQSQNITFYTVGGNKENGLVISDCKEDLEKGTDYETLKKLKGNQFVWVPVENVVANSYDEAKEMVKNDKYPLVVKDGDNYKTLIYYFDGNNKEIKLNVGSFEITSEPLSNDSDEKQRFNEMVEYLIKYKGFYVSMFEIGNITNLQDNGDNKGISKYGQNHIAENTWSNMFSLCKNMYQYKNAKSEMIWGCQWNAILIWFYSNESTRDYAFSMKNKGNFSGKLNYTGENPNYCINNIYDIFGNVAEWTQASTGEIYRLAVGSNFENADSNYISETDFTDNPENSYKFIGTRAVLYLYE